MTTYEHAPVSRWLKAIGLLVLATAVLAVAGCGGSDTPAVCDSLETLSGDIDGLKNIDLKADGAAAAVQESLDSIQSDVEAVKSDAAAELSEPIAGLENSLKELSGNVDAVKAAGTVSAESAQAIGDSLAAVGTSWDALKTAAPDCDL